MPPLFDFANGISEEIQFSLDPSYFNYYYAILDDYIQACNLMYGPYSYPYWDPSHESDLFWGENGAALWITDGQVVVNFINLCYQIGYVGSNQIARLRTMADEGLL